MARSKSSGRWLREHFGDPYVAEAKRQGYRSRAAYKLKQLDERHHIFKPGMLVVDLGAAPGSWSQYVTERIGQRGCVIATDILPMDSFSHVTFVQGDFTQQSVLDALLVQVAGRPVALVISDMAPNMSGMDAVDQPRSMLLADLAFELAQQVLAADGGFITKLFQGEGFDEYIYRLRQQFKRVVVRKPDASRSRSREVYALATGFQGG